MYPRSAWCSRRRDFPAVYAEGWTGSYEKWFQCSLIVQSQPEVIARPRSALGSKATEMKAYLQYLRDESKNTSTPTQFAGCPSGSSSVPTVSGVPARLYMNVERA